MTLFQMEVLVAVTNAGNFTRAGEQIGLSQSGVSHTIGALEKELGVSLFTRNRSGVKLTAAGEKIVASARIILENVSLIKQVAAESGDHLEVTLRIASFPSVTAQLLPKLLKSIESHYPHMQTKLYEGSYQEIKEWIRSGVVDVGFHVWPDDELEGILLTTDALHAVVPAKHPLAQEPSLTLEQLARESFLMPMAGCHLLIGAEFAKAGLTPNVSYEIADHTTILAMVESGVGVTVVPSLTLPAQLPDVAIKEITPPLSRQIGLAVRSLREAPPAVQAFLREAERIVPTL
ncbi:LysR family transcriptional regulator [Brevibacillus sp. HB1.3]|uniref:LysR family transcriptional regulator n=1 Tax=Brevibacillus sp. HB1.3 TaxID=2738842 RepID=UPI001553F0CE|nr:LysR family transcriptional regulator [Brevibacillus sp. HB1.3]NQF14372.1 LysR family transcriptional regulator [Brevibacillus sp. HB1.3]